jgi:hypothetical protein
MLSGIGGQVELQRLGTALCVLKLCDIPTRCLPRDDFAEPVIATLASAKTPSGGRAQLTGCRPGGWCGAVAICVG